MKLLLSTSPDRDAERIARALLDEKLIACANLVAGVRSLYWWKGAVERSDETILVMKTTDELAGRAVERLKELHPYEVPEAVLLDITGGWPPYLAWIAESTAGAAG